MYSAQYLFSDHYISDTFSFGPHMLHNISFNVLNNLMDYVLPLTDFMNKILQYFILCYNL